MSEDNNKLVKQNEVIISLLGRLVFKPEEVATIVTRRKRNPQNYINGYNACDGNRTISEIANLVGVTQPNLSPILQGWEEIGIIYEIEKSGGKYYKKLFPIELE